MDLIRNNREPIPQRVEELATIAIDSAYAVYRDLGRGLLESAYEYYLIDELTMRGLKIKNQLSMPVVRNNKNLEGVYRIDILVEDSLILEIKSVESIIPVHRSQLMTYLKFSGCRLGLILNFNEKLFKNGIKRVVY
jgi:GxxExxY protein